jgi:serine protease Do
MNPLVVTRLPERFRHLAVFTSLNGLFVSALSVFFLAETALGIEEIPPPGITATSASSLPAWDKKSPESVADLLAIQARVQKVWGDVSSAIVGVKAHEGEGSGVVVTKDGYVLTAGHVSGEPGRLVELHFQDGRIVTAETLGMSTVADTGMCKIQGDGEFPFVEMAEPDSYKVGSWCIAIGNPNGYDPERGLVLRTGRVISADRNTIRTDCKIVGGDSGGPLFDLDGKVIGIHSRISMNNEDNFHATIEAFAKDWEKLQDGREIKRVSQAKRGHLGVIPGRSKGDGVLVQNVGSGSAAQISGIKSGDVVVRVDDDVINNTDDLKEAISMRKVDEEIVIRVKRGDEEIDIKVILLRRGE